MRRICIVAPPGAGKTRLGVEIPLRIIGPVLWLAHRRELISQAAHELELAGHDVACVSPVHPPDPWARVQVASISTLLSRVHRPPAELVILDECHHYIAARYRTVADAYPNALHVGLTATPQRQDGKPLGDMFDSLIVAASYSELLADGHLVPCKVFRPDEYLGRDLARDPLDAWRRVCRVLGSEQQTFAFAPDIQRAQEFAALFSRAGIPSLAVHEKTPKSERAEALERFRDGELRVLWNVFVFTEGTNVPQATCCLLARGVGHAGPYLQITGRVLRAVPGKTHATLIDLAGVSHLHGLPTQDREYALDGRSISVIGESLKNCPQCGIVLPSAARECEECGYQFQVTPRKAPKIWDLELREAVEAAGGDPAHVDDTRKLREWRRLRDLCAERGYGIYWAVKQFREQGLGDPPMGDVSEKEKVRELSRLVALARERGFKPGFARVRFKELFGSWPRAEMLQVAELWHG